MPEASVPRPWWIYVLKDPETLEVRYVGWTIDLTRRLRDHLKASQLARQNYRARWLNGLAGRGLKPTMEIVEEGSGDGWQAAEKRWIAHFKSDRLTNHTDGGDGTPGRHPSAETRARWSVIRKGRAPSPKAIARSVELTKGKSRPVAYLQPMWDAIRSNRRSVEHSAAISRANKGRPKNFTPEQRQAAALRILKAGELSRTPEAIEKSKRGRLGRKINITEKDRERRRIQMTALQKSQMEKK